MNKFNSKKVSFAGYTFDSRAEYYRYRELLILEKAGEISNLAVHGEDDTTFTLIPAFKKGRRKYRAITYTVDFAYTVKNNRFYEDVKGSETESWKIKSKLLMFQKPDIKLIISKPVYDRRTKSYTFNIKEL